MLVGKMHIDGAVMLIHQLSFTTEHRCVYLEQSTVAEIRIVFS